MLHIRYPDYVACTTPMERLLYRCYLALKSAKEEHVREHLENERTMQEIAQEGINPATFRP